jgi:ribosomal protein L22
MTNTEKPTGKAEQKKVETAKAQKKQNVSKTPIQKKNIAEPKKDSENKIIDNQIKGEEKKKPIQKKEKRKKIDAIVNGINLPISTKYSVAICKFIRNKKIKRAIADLEQVLVYKKAIPMKGEIPHRKGKGIMSGRYPKRAVEYFIKLLKSLSANANEIDNPIIVEAIVNIASRPFGRFGRIRKKRTHVKIVVKEKKTIKKNKKLKK